MADTLRCNRTDAATVWEAAMASVDDIGLALVESEEEHGRIRARAKASIWDFKGHVLLVVVREVVHLLRPFPFHGGVAGPGGLGPCFFAVHP